MITNRSNHIPMFTKMHSTNTMIGLRRIFFDQKNCGMSTLQLTIAKYDHQNGPNARLMNANRSYRLPEYQAMKNSVAYARPTTVSYTHLTLPTSDLV